MTIAMLMPLLDFDDLARFYQINKTCKAILTPGDSKCLRFDILFDKRTFIDSPNPEWRELLIMEAQPQQDPSFGKLMLLAKSFLLVDTRVRKIDKV